MLCLYWRRLDHEPPPYPAPPDHSIDARCGTGGGTVGRLRPVKLRAERTARRARPAADQQPDPDADQPEKMLVNLPYSLVSTITSQIRRTEQLLNQAQPSPQRLDDPPGFHHKLRRDHNSRAISSRWSRRRSSDGRTPWRARRTPCGCRAHWRRQHPHVSNLGDDVRRVKPVGIRSPAGDATGEQRAPGAKSGRCRPRFRNEGALKDSGLMSPTIPL
jgi:hypothetical protein